MTRAGGPPEGTRARPRPEWRAFAFPRSLVGLSFVVVFLAGAAAFWITGAGHVAVMQSEGIDATPTGYRFDAGDGAAVVHVRIRIENPTPRAVTVKAIQGFRGRIDGETVARGDGAVETTRVPARGSATVTAVLQVDGEVDPGRVRAAVRADEFRAIGVVVATIGREGVTVAIREGEG